MENLEYCARKLASLGFNEGANKFEIYWEKSSSLSIEVQDGKVDTLSQANDQGITIRTLRDGKLGFSYTFDLSKSAIDRAIETAIEVGTIMPADAYNDLQSLGEYPYTDIHSFDEKGLNVPLERKIEIAKELESNAKKMDKRIKRVRAAGFDQSSSHMILVDSNQEQISFQSTLFTAYLTCVAESEHDANQAEMGSDAQYTTHFDQLDHAKVSKLAVSNAIELLDFTQAKTMKCPAVFKSSVVAQLLGFLASSFSAENVDKNFSLLSGKLGEKVFSEKLTLINDGLLPGGVSTAPFDGEGTPMKSTTLIDGGRLNSYLFDQYYSKKWNAEKKIKTSSTASSRRGSLKSSPSIGISNLVLKKGADSFERLLSSAKDGIYVTQVMGLHTANPITGDFSLGASGILIQNGVLGKPVKGFAIAGNILELLKNVEKVGSDQRNFGSLLCSSLLISELSVGGS